MSGWRGASKDDNIVSPSTTAHSTSLSHTLAINISRTSSLSSFVIRGSATLSVFPTPCRAACSKATLMRADMTDVAASSSSIRFPTAVSSRRPAGKDRQRRFSHVARLAREARSRRLRFEMTKTRTRSSHLCGSKMSCAGSIQLVRRFGLPPLGAERTAWDESE